MDKILDVAQAWFMIALMCCFVGSMIWVSWNQIAPVALHLAYFQCVWGVFLFIVLRRLVLEGIDT